MKVKYKPNPYRALLKKHLDEKRRMMYLAGIKPSKEDDDTDV